MYLKKMHSFSNKIRLVGQIKLECPSQKKKIQLKMTKHGRVVLDTNSNETCKGVFQMEELLRKWS